MRASAAAAATISARSPVEHARDSAGVGAAIAEAPERDDRGQPDVGVFARAAARSAISTMPALASRRTIASMTADAHAGVAEQARSARSTAGPRSQPSTVHQRRQTRRLLVADTASRIRCAPAGAIAAWNSSMT